VPLPVEGHEGKRIYVWFEAVIGYLSACVEWAGGRPEAWEPFWKDQDTRAYYFIGKDNIPFHTMIWPAMLMGYEGLNLPYDVPANEFLSLENRQFSTSRDWAVWMPDYLDRYEVDSIRYALAAIMPETSDSDFNWTEFVRRNNDELVATYGNLVHRVLTMVGRNFDRTVPNPGELDEESKVLLDEAGRGLEAVSSELGRCRFRNALQSAMGIARSANRYLDSKAPWQAVRTDKDDAARTLWTAMSVINCLKTAFYPFMPGTSEKLQVLLGLNGTVKAEGWSWDRAALSPGSPLPRPRPLFTKLDETIIEEERSRLGG
jgi:methionyl-tRNA synthetase